ncbi:MAG: NAD-dependent epimerase/dehydratase family protein [bacterium]|nr:NAD-dependent epimerase/dehydratase family protein [bacterium]
MNKVPILDRKNVLITGGAGFIGSHLCDALVKTAHVICVDNFATSAVANIQHLLQDPNFEFINQDINQPFQLADFSELERFHVNIQGVQEVYHLACPISRTHFNDYKIATLLTNSLGTKNVLDVAVASHAKTLFASSSALYGKRQDDHRISETEPCTIDHLTSGGAYDEGKRFSEALFYTFQDVYGLDVKIARIFRTYGPRMKLFDGHMIPDMVRAAIEGEPVELADPESRVNLCYVTDIVDGLIRHMESSQDVTVMNLGSSEEVPLKRLAELIMRAADSSSVIQVTPSAEPVSEPMLPDITRARQLLRWVPLVRLEDGLKAVVEDAQSRRHQLSL